MNSFELIAFLVFLCIGLPTICMTFVFIAIAREERLYIKRGLHDPEEQFPPHIRE